MPPAACFSIELPIEQSHAGGARWLPVLPPGCVNRGELIMPRAVELEAMPDGKALEIILRNLLTAAAGDTGGDVVLQGVGGGGAVGVGQAATVPGPGGR